MIADLLIDMNVGSANGTVLTTTIMGTGTQGTDAGFDVVPVPPTGLTVDAHQINMLEAVTITGAGTFAPSHTARAFILDCTRNFTYAQWWTNNVATRVVSIGGWWMPGPANVGVAGQLWDTMQFVGTLGGEVTFQLQNGQSGLGSGYGVNIETVLAAATTHSSFIEVAPNTWYWVTVGVNYTTGVARCNVYNTSGAQLGATITKSFDVAPEDVESVRFGNNEIGNTAGTMRWENWLIDFTNGVFPLGPGAPPISPRRSMRPFPFKPGSASRFR